MFIKLKFVKLEMRLNRKFWQFVINLLLQTVKLILILKWVYFFTILQHLAYIKIISIESCL